MLWELFNKVILLGGEITLYVMLKNGHCFSDANLGNT